MGSTRHKPRLFRHFQYKYNGFPGSLLFRLLLLIIRLISHFLLWIFFLFYFPLGYIDSFIMKAQCDLQMASKHSENKILKARSLKDRDVPHEEMQSLLMKLKDLVPNVPRNRKLSKLEIIQYVIDYILDLQIALETHPAVVSKPASTAAVAASLAVISPCRQPLGVLPPSANTCAAQEVIQIEKVPTHLAESITTSRPVSC